MNRFFLNLVAIGFVCYFYCVDKWRVFRSALTDCVRGVNDGNGMKEYQLRGDKGFM